MARILCQYNGEDSGPLLLVIAGIHGNEKTGVLAAQQLYGMLLEEPNRNPSFNFIGSFAAILANERAYHVSQRFLDEDMNRMLTPARIAEICLSNHDDLLNEEREIYEFYHLVNQLIADSHCDSLVVIDLHTTSADGGIFTIPGDDAGSLAIARQMHCPVVRGFINELKGTSLHYFTSQNIGIPCCAVVFEAGQHEDTQAVNRSVSAMVNVLRSIGSVHPQDVQSKHDEILSSFRPEVPRLLDLVYRHEIKDEEQFELISGMRNFDKLAKDQLLGIELNHELLCPMDGYILMPRYQNKGRDGFFIVR